MLELGPGSNPSNQHPRYTSFANSIAIAIAIAIAISIAIAIVIDVANPISIAIAIFIARKCIDSTFTGSVSGSSHFAESGSELC
jgi:hypothetical protein